MMIFSFPPITTPRATTLILGSMPGKASLAAGQYYAHPRNAFWPIFRTLLSLDADATYEQRTAALQQHQIALWDVLQSCQRASSLDADIEPASIVPNDFREFFSTHPAMTRVFFNGATAETLFRRHVLPSLSLRAEGLSMVRLPSTSPAHAGLSVQAKLAVWRQVLDASPG